MITDKGDIVMKKTILVLIAVCVLISQSAFAANDIIYTTESAEFQTNREWSKGEYGYGEKPALFAQAKPGDYAAWRLIGPAAGPYRFYYWITLTEHGAEKAQVIFGSETQELTADISFSKGAAGWKEIGVLEHSNTGSSFRMFADSGEVYVSAIKMVPLDVRYNAITTLFNTSPAALLLKVGSNAAYRKCALYRIDDAVPVIYNSTTLVPLRFISENLGAEVSWDNDTRTAKIVSPGKTLEFSPDKATFLDNGTEYTLMQQPVIENGRILVPIRIISEHMNKQVFWDETGVIIIGDALSVDKERNRGMLDNLASILEEENNFIADTVEN